MSIQERQFCLEYLITGVHQQIKNQDCLFCFPEKLQQEMEKIEQKLKEEQEEEKDLPNEDEFEDTYETLKKQAEEKDDEEEEETQNLVEKQKEKQIEQKLLQIQQQCVEQLDQLLKNEKNIEFILDNSMGILINPNNLNENRFTLAIRILSLTLEKWQPTLKKSGNEQERLKNQELYQQELQKYFNIYTSEQDVQLSQELTQISKLQQADEFLESIQLHGRKDRILSTLQSRIQNSSPQITSIIVFTDFITKDFTAWKQQIEEAIKQRQNVPKIHIISFNMSEKQEEKQASLDFYDQISKLTHGTFKGLSSL
ncbi:hypothetical protein ABPG74_007044 [Tetrahymena malaccensis]